MRARPGYTWAERQRRADLVAHHREAFGDVCPGYQRAAHAIDYQTNPLTADHVYPVGRGGDEDGDLQILCRSCNSTKRDGRSRGSRRSVSLGQTPTQAWRCTWHGGACASRVHAGWSRPWF